MLKHLDHILFISGTQEEIKDLVTCVTEFIFPAKYLLLVLIGEGLLFLFPEFCTRDKNVH